MKKLHLSLIAAIAGLLVISSCEDLLSDLLKFDTDYFGYNFTIEPNDPGTYAYPKDTIDFDAESVMSSITLTANDLESATVSDGLAIMLTSDENFNSLSSMELWLQTPGLDAEKIAWIDEVPVNADTLDLNLTATNLVEYLQEDQFILWANAVLAEAIEEPLDVQVRVRFLLRAKEPDTAGQ